MAGAVRTVTGLLLLSFISTGATGDDGPTLAENSYEIIFPCGKDLVCYHIWQINTGEASEPVAIVGNGEIQPAESEETECSLPIKSLTAEDVGRHRCQKRPNVFSPHNSEFYQARSAAPMLNLISAKTVSLQCVFLTYVEQGHCFTPRAQRLVSLTWVDEAGAEIQDDYQHQINLRSSCDITLIVTLQHPDSKRFRCQASVAQQVQTSVEFRVAAPASKGKGKRILIEVEPEQQGGDQDVVGAAVGAASCVVLAAAAAVYVVNRKRTNGLRPAAPGSVQPGPSNVMNTDDVIYADITLPVDSDQVRVHECEATEYACVRYK